MKGKKKQQASRVPRSIRRLFPKVDDVKDATKNVEVTVTKRDSMEGRRLQSTECALARAAKREYDADGVVIGITASYIIKGNTAIRFRTPDTVAREIVSFDRHHDFAPGKYGLSAVSPSQRLDRDRSNEKRSSGSSSSNRIVHKETARVRILEKGGK